MAIFDYVNSIPFDGFPFLIVNGYEFHWDGHSWQRQIDNLTRK